MNKYDKRYEIRLANQSDTEDIMKFIDDYWKKGHIVSKDRSFFEYEYSNGDDVNFIIAIDRNTDLIEGILGFIRCSNTEDPEKKDIWAGMWKVNNLNHNLAFLGLELGTRLREITGYRTCIGSGLNSNTAVPLTKVFSEDECVKMKHYYLLNPFTNEYKIAVVKDKNLKCKDLSFIETEIERFKSIEEVCKHFNIEQIDAIPYKDNWYINKRYFNHPYYDYLVYGLKNKLGQVEALLIAREIEVEGVKVLRIVDYVGKQKLFSGLFDQFEKMFKNCKYEYIDFYNHGFDEEFILKSGFNLRTEDDRNIIPNYFEPFLQENVDIWVHYQLSGTMFFKADSDQDRPNEIRTK